jgi:hypothetical protein
MRTPIEGLIGEWKWRAALQAACDCGRVLRLTSGTYHELAFFGHQNTPNYDFSVIKCKLESSTRNETESEKTPD